MHVSVTGMTLDGNTDPGLFHLGSGKFGEICNTVSRDNDIAFIHIRCGCFQCFKRCSSHGPYCFFSLIGIAQEHVFCSVVQTNLCCCITSALHIFHGTSVKHQDQIRICRTVRHDLVQIFCCFIQQRLRHILNGSRIQIRIDEFRYRSHTLLQ